MLISCQQWGDISEISWFCCKILRLVLHMLTLPSQHWFKGASLRILNNCPKRVHSHTPTENYQNITKIMAWWTNSASRHFLNIYIYIYIYICIYVYEQPGKWPWGWHWRANCESCWRSKWHNIKSQNIIYHYISPHTQLHVVFVHTRRQFKQYTVSSGWLFLHLQSGPSNCRCPFKSEQRVHRLPIVPPFRFVKPKASHFLQINAPRPLGPFQYHIRSFSSSKWCLGCSMSP